MAENDKKVISIVTNCWNEVDNIPLFYQRCKAELEKFPQYEYEFIVSEISNNKEILLEDELLINKTINKKLATNNINLNGEDGYVVSNNLLK